ncbi:MAG: restriction endonuclease subunit S [Burkholderiaceae bacterium]
MTEAAVVRTGPTQTGGREATTGHIAGDCVIAVGTPDTGTPPGWRWKLLTKLARLETGHTPSRGHPEYWDGDIPWIGIRDATANHGRTLHDTEQHVTQEGIDNSSARVLPTNTVCLSRTASVGYVVVMGRPMATSQDFVNWVCDPKVLDYRYLKYALLAEGTSYSRFSHGTTHQTIYFPEVKAFHLCTPSRDTQSTIADVLSALDDKIEQNRRTAQALERLARAIFRAWFVDFEPVKAKAAGATAFPSMPQSVFDALPTRFVDSAIGPMPEGWDVLRLDGLLTLQRGFDLPKQSRGDGLHPIFAASGLNGFHSEWKVKGPGVTTGRSGILGQVFFVDRDFWPLNTSLWVKEYKRSNPWHAYFLLQTLDLAQFNAGSAVPTLNRNHVHSLPIVAPPETLLRAFEETCRVTFSLDQHSRSESEMLAAIRDYLLPKLLSGNVRVEAVHG